MSSGSKIEVVRPWESKIEEVKRPWTVVRPWGSFVVIDTDRDDFLRTYFPNHQSQPGEVYKLLTVNPGCRLSWQYHNRRHEYWNVISGPVLMYLSDNDEIPTPCHYESGSIITIPVLHRHMAEALTTPVVIAEIWSHCSDLPSTEEDIVRVTDWYHR